ncbi:hypothetical protein IAT40_004504 [Kwoniella sp. CBS 6097]
MTMMHSKRSTTQTSRVGSVKGLFSRFVPSRHRRSSFSLAKFGHDTGSVETDYSGDTAAGSTGDPSELFTKTKDRGDTLSQRPSTIASRKIGEWVSRQTSKLAGLRPTRSSNAGLPADNCKDGSDKPPPPYRATDEERHLALSRAQGAGTISNTGNPSTPGPLSFGLVLNDNGRSPRLPVDSEGFTPGTTSVASPYHRSSDPYASHNHPDYFAMGLPPSRPLSLNSDASAWLHSDFPQTSVRQIDAYPLPGAEPEPLGRLSSLDSPSIMSAPSPSTWSLEPRLDDPGVVNGRNSVARSIRSSVNGELNTSRWSDDSLEPSDVSVPRSSRFGSSINSFNSRSGRGHGVGPYTGAHLQGEMSLATIGSRLSKSSVSSWGRDLRPSATSNFQKFLEHGGTHYTHDGIYLNKKFGQLGRASSRVFSKVFPSEAQKAEKARSKLKASISGPLELVGEPTYVAPKTSSQSASRGASVVSLADSIAIPPLPNIGSPVSSGNTELFETASSHSEGDSQEDRSSGVQGESTPQGESTSHGGETWPLNDSEASKEATSSDVPFKLSFNLPDLGDPSDFESTMNSVADRLSASDTLDSTGLYRPSYGELHSRLSVDNRFDS